MDGAPEETIDVTTRFHVVTCQQCGMAFAMPAEFFLDRASHREPFHCPAAHINVIHTQKTPPLGWLPLLAAQARENTQLRFRLDNTTIELAKFKPDPAAAAGAAEVKRRAGILSERAELVAYGRRLCRFCGKPSRSLRRHMIVAHKEELSALPADALD